MPVKMENFCNAWKRCKKKKKNGEDGISLACALNCGYGEVALHHGLADAVH